MKELVVISGKGGTGKTSLAASFAALARDKVMADCDVDAADLHLVLQPDIQRRQTFSGGHKAVIRGQDCTGCGLCEEACRFEAVRRDKGGVFCVDELSCEGCGVCVRFCPAKAIDFPERESGEWYVSQTRHGTLVHARLGAAEENSGKLVTQVRREASRMAAEQGVGLVIVDGPPGIGCPVIASLAGASLALIVTEPTVSGRHDMERVAELCRRLGVSAAVCVNKCDINPFVTAEICRWSQERALAMAGELPYDAVVTRAQLAGRSVVEMDGEPMAGLIRQVWERVHGLLEKQ
ncbi:MAG TPA: ATP-binding protein [Candidatus Brocadiia bacterium]|nr:ATP-binding protein [Candidatus Brocadiia bacterium]